MNVLRYSPDPLSDNQRRPTTIEPQFEEHPTFARDYDTFEFASRWEEYSGSILVTLFSLYCILDECLNTLDKTGYSCPEAVRVQTDAVRMEAHSFLTTHGAMPKTHRGWLSDEDI
jgi:hypothetical protein